MCRPTRLDSRSFGPVQPRRLRAQIFVRLAFTVNPFQIFCLANSAAAGSPPPNIADAFVEFDTLRDTRRGAWPRFARTPAYTRARTLRKRTHTQPDHRSPVARALPSCGSRTTRRHAPRSDVPTSYFSLCSTLFAKAATLAGNLPTQLARERRNRCGVREELVAVRTALVNCVRGWTRTLLLKFPSGVTTTLTKRIRDAATKHPPGLPEYIERVLASIDAIQEQIRKADKGLEQLPAEDPVCQRLMSVPGVGVGTSMRFVAAIDDVARFPSAHAVQSYLGLTPGEHSSSDRRQRTGITKAGPAPVRRTLTQAAWALRRSHPKDPISLWATDIELRRGKFIATIAVARKLAGVLYALWRDNSRYTPNYVARNRRA